MKVGLALQDHREEDKVESVPKECWSFQHVSPGMPVRCLMVAKADQVEGDRLVVIHVPVLAAVANCKERSRGCRDLLDGDFGHGPDWILEMSSHNPRTDDYWRTGQIQMAS